MIVLEELDIFLHFSSQHAPRYERYFLQPLLKGICDKASGIRQASAFGIGVMAQFAGDHFSQHCLGRPPGGALYLWTSLLYLCVQMCMYSSTYVVKIA